MRLRVGITAYRKQTAPLIVSKGRDLMLDARHLLAVLRDSVEHSLDTLISGSYDGGNIELTPHLERSSSRGYVHFDANTPAYVAGVHGWLTETTHPLQLFFQSRGSALHLLCAIACKNAHLIKLHMREKMVGPKMKYVITKAAPTHMTISRRAMMGSLLRRGGFMKGHTPHTCKQIQDCCPQ
jgi:hypothetical protein